MTSRSSISTRIRRKRSMRRSLPRRRLSNVRRPLCGARSATCPMKARCCWPSTSSCRQRMLDKSAPHRSSADAALIVELSARLREAEETLDAIRNGDIDSVLVGHAGASTIFTVENADRPYRFLIEQMKEGAMTLSEEGIVLYGNR